MEMDEIDDRGSRSSSGGLTSPTNVGGVSEVHEKEIIKVKKEMDLLIHKYNKELENAKKDAKHRTDENSNIILTKLKEKEDEIEILEKSVENFMKTKNEEILLLKVEYEEKIGKIKSQVDKTKTPVLSHTTKNDEIFRKKYEKLEIRYKEEVSLLQQEIEQLKSENQTSKNKVVTPLSSLLYNPGTPKETVVKDYTYLNMYKRQNDSKENSVIRKPLLNRRKQINNREELTKLQIKITSDHTQNNVEHSRITNTVVPFKQRKLFNPESSFLPK